MLLTSIRRPDLILKLSSLVTLGMLEDAFLICARVVFADRLRMSELAIGYCAIRAVATRGHCRMFEWALFVRAIGIPYALGLRCIRHGVCDPLRR